MNDVRANIVDHLPALQRYAMKLACNPTTAQDLVQECTVRALSKSNLYNSGTNMRAWLFTILHNLHVSSSRRQARHPNVKDPEPALARLATPAPQVAKVMLGEVGKAISQLPKNQRNILMSIGVEGKSYREVSTAFGIPVGTVKSRYARARETLAENLKMAPDETLEAA